MRPLIRSFRRRAYWSRVGRTLFFICALWTVIETYFVRQALLAGAPKGIVELSSQKIFITSLHWNNEPILRSHWNAAVYELVQVIGKANVFVSILESGSFVDDTKGALRELDYYLGELGVRRRTIIEDIVHTDILLHRPAEVEEGWIRSQNGSMELRRIPYLAKLRQRALEPMYELEKAGETFDKILILNDVAFTTEHIRRLLNTNGGEYAAACTLDFAKPPAFYDTFALRDWEGHQGLMGRWPYFRGRVSRQAIKRNQDVPVKSCWNGLVMMDAAPFYATESRLAFRGIPDSLSLHRLEGSECCLIHTDNPLSASKGVFLNPNVRVGYNESAYQTVNPPAGVPWLSIFDIVWGSWENRVRRWLSSDWLSRSRTARKITSWQGQGESKGEGSTETGQDCLIDEMQVVSWNGWAHI